MPFDPPVNLPRLWLGRMSAGQRQRWYDFRCQGSRWCRDHACR